MMEETPNDAYQSYGGSAVPYAWGDVDGVDVELQVELARHPNAEEARALERAIQAWSNHGVLEGYGAGWLHGLYGNRPDWTGSTLRWLEDFGSADPTLAADELARSLAGWSAQWGVPIVGLRFGE
jgi:hypothetical protein